MQIKARSHEVMLFMSLRPTNYVFGRIFRFGKIKKFPGLGYIVNDAEMARKILHDEEHFSIKVGGGLGDLIAEVWGTTPILLSMEGKEHTRVKFELLELLEDDMLPKIIGDELINFSKSLKKKVVSPEGVDIVQETRIATNRITSRLLGVDPPSDADLLEISKLVTSSMGCIDVRHKTYTRAKRKKIIANVEKFRQIAEEYYKQASKNKNSIIGRLKKLGYEEESTYGFISMFLIAGTVTVSSALPRIIAILLDTNQLDSLKNDPQKIKTAITEGLRYVTPGPLLLHGVKKDVTLEGKKIKAGERIMILLYNIMHSPQYTDNPFTFNIDREQNKLIDGLWFGTGAHFCMGSVVAKKEITTAIQALAPYAGRLKILQRKYKPDGINPGYDKLIVKA